MKSVEAAPALLIKAKGGFGNRILSACTGIVLAMTVGRVPIIDWRDGEYLPAGEDAYPQLFRDPVGVSPSSFDGDGDVSPAIWRDRLSQHPTQIISDLYPDDHSNPLVYRRLSLDLSRPRTDAPVAVFWSYLPKMARVRRRARRHPEFAGMSSADMMRWALSRHFRPNLRVEAAVTELFANRKRPVIGVHIRYTDRKVSLRRIFRDVSALRRSVPDASIFLATDNLSVQQRFCAEYADVFVIDKTLGDDDHSLHEHLILEDPLAEAENALIDMWALASCDWLVHSRHSTFSVAAALIGGIPRARQRDIDRRNPRVVLKRWVQTWA